VHEAGLDATLRQRREHFVKTRYLISSEGTVLSARTIGHAEMRVDPLQVDRRARREDVDDLVDVVGRHTHPVHPVSTFT